MIIHFYIIYFENYKLFGYQSGRISLVRFGSIFKTLLSLLIFIINFV